MHIHFRKEGDKVHRKSMAFIVKDIRASFLVNDNSLFFQVCYEVCIRIFIYSFIHSFDIYCAM